jgi:hypothetical protein
MSLADPILAGLAIIPCAPPAAGGPEVVWAFNLPISAAADRLRRILKQPASNLCCARDPWGVYAFGMGPAGHPRIFARVCTGTAIEDDLNRALETLARQEREEQAHG